MSQHDGAGENDRSGDEGSGQNSTAETKTEALTGDLTLETLNRYLAVAAEDREAAEERSSQVIARFTKLTVAMMCVTMVIAGANVAMILRQSGAPQAAAMAPRPVETPTAVIQPALPIEPTPTLPAVPTPVQPVEKVPLLGSPSETKARRVPTPGPPKLARTAPPRPQPLLSVRNADDDARESGHVERW